MAMVLERFHRRIRLAFIRGCCNGAARTYREFLHVNTHRSARCTYGKKGEKYFTIYDVHVE